MATSENPTPVTTENPPPAAPKKRKAGPGRPPAAAAPEVRANRGESFAQTIAKIPDADWGTRVGIYLYRLEPYTDRRKSGEFVHVMVYEKPVDEEMVKFDHGSGGYRFMLAQKKQGGNRGDQLCSHDFQINDPRFPPKIAPGEWVDDPRNSKWAWAREHVMRQMGQNGQPQAASPVSALKEVLEVGEMIKAQTQTPAVTPTPPVSDLDQFTKFLALQKALQPSPPSEAPKPQTDPIDTAVKIVTLMQGGGQATLMQMFQGQLEAMRLRNEKLEDELRRKPEPIQPPNPSDPMTVINSFKAIREALGLGGEDDGPVRRGKTDLVELAIDKLAVPALQTIQPFANVLANVMGQKMMQSMKPSAANQPAQQQTQALAAPIQTVDPRVAFLQKITPKMIEMLMQDAPGGDFAELMAEWEGIELVKQMQAATPDQMVAVYQATDYWAVLQPREQQFRKFIGEFIAWKPEEDEPAQSASQFKLDEESDDE